jgi:hypothetical protein
MTESSANMVRIELLYDSGGQYFNIPIEFERSIDWTSVTISKSDECVIFAPGAVLDPGGEPAADLPATG